MSAALGMRLPNRLRAEAEIAYRQYDVDSLTVTNAGDVSGLSTGTAVTVSGDVTALALMANGLYDFETDWLVTPFVMGGIGTAMVVANDVKSGTVKIADDGAWVFAYQFGAGVSYAFDKRWSLEASYRLFGTTDPELKDTAGDKFDTEFMSHSFLFGARYEL